MANKNTHLQQANEDQVDKKIPENDLQTEDDLTDPQEPTSADKQESPEKNPEKDLPEIESDTLEKVAGNSGNEDENYDSLDVKQLLNLLEKKNKVWKSCSAAKRG